MQVFFGAVGGRHDRHSPDVPVPCVQALAEGAGGGTVDILSSGILRLAATASVATIVRGSRRLVLDGWLADRAGLAAALSVVPSTTDADLVAIALERWGEMALSRLHGHFALAWWDETARHLLLACDRKGGRTLFLHADGNRLAFSGLLSALLADPAVSRAADPDRLARAAFCNGPGWDAVCLRGIDRLSPAHLLRWTPSGVGVERYWRLDPSRRVRFARDQDYVEAARELLDRVVADALPSEGPIVARMTGGLDSTALAATAARLSGQAIHTLTVRPDPTAVLSERSRFWFSDEWPHVMAVAEMYPALRPLPVFAQLGSLGDHLRAEAAVVGRPAVHLMATFWAAGLWPEARRLGASVILNGASGNATLSATGLAPPGQRWSLSDLPGPLADGWMRWHHNRATTGFLQATRSAAPVWLRAGYRRLRGRPVGLGWRDGLAIRPAAMRRIGMKAIVDTEMQGGDPAIPWRLRARINLIERTWAANALGSPQRFRLRIESLDPLGDVRMAEFCLALPPDQFTRGPVSRFLARRVLADRLPPMVTGEVRRGLQNPEWFDWLTRSRDWMAAELDGIDASPLGREIIDVPRLRAILDDWPADADTAWARYEELMGVLGRGVALGVFARWADGV